MSINVLNKNQRRALASLMRCRTISEAAIDCGLSERTLGRYLSDPHFRKELDQRESVLIDEAGRLLIQGQKKALAVLSNLMTNGENESTRRLAAANWIDFTLRLRELRNVEERLTALEEKVYAKN